MNRKQKFHKKTKFLSTSDNWYPNYPDNQVEVSLHFDEGENGGNTWRVSVWGEDDMGMELGGMVSYVESLELFKKLDRIQPLKQKQLVQLGFVKA